MKKFYLFMALCLMSFSAAEASKICYCQTGNYGRDAVIYYKEKPSIVSTTTFIENWLRHSWSYEEADKAKKIERITLDESMKDYVSENLSYFFSGMPDLEEITNLSYLNTSKAKNMEQMFSGCKKLKAIDCRQFNTANVENMEMMFDNCRSLRLLDVSSFNTSKVTNMAMMFRVCESLETLDLSNFMTYKVTKMNEMFEDCTQLRELNISSFNTSNVTTMYFMFSGCKNLTALDVSLFNTANVTNMVDMFAYCEKLQSLDLYGFSTKSLKNASYMFYNCTSLKTIYSKADMTGIEKGEYMFSGCSSLRGDNGSCIEVLRDLNVEDRSDKAVARLDGGAPAPGYFSKGREVFGVLSDDGKTITLWYDNNKEAYKGVQYWKLGEKEHAKYEKATKVVLHSTMDKAYPVETVDWFAFLYEVTEIVNMKYLHTDYLANANGMFSYCEKLNSIPMTNWKTPRLQYTEGMFMGCESLTVLHLENLNMSKVKSAGGMFSGCTKLRAIYCEDDWGQLSDLSADYMFRNCSKLVGGKGTPFNQYYIGKTYARPDDGPGSLSPGYFWRAGDTGLVPVTPDPDPDPDPEPEPEPDPVKLEPLATCIISATGSYDFVRSRILIEDDEVALAFVTSDDWQVDWSNGAIDYASDGYMLMVTLDNITNPGDLRGKYTASNEGLKVNNSGLVIAENKEKSDIYTGIAGSVEITMNEEGTGYNMKYSLSLKSEESGKSLTVKGNIYDICADELPDAREPEGLESIQNSEFRIQKVLRNGMLFIEHNGNTYNATGIKVK